MPSESLDADPLKVQANWLQSMLKAAVGSALGVTVAVTESVRVVVPPSLSVTVSDTG